MKCLQTVCPVLFIVFLLISIGCQNASNTPIIMDEEITVSYDFPALEYLSEYGLFEMPLHTMTPVKARVYT